MPPLRTIVIVPTYNEAENIGPLLDALLAHPARFDVLIVDDTSPDGTANEVKQRQSELEKNSDRRLLLLERPGKQGLGRAYRQAHAWALAQGYDRIAQMDADFSHSPEDLSPLLEACTTHDLAIGCRFMPGGKTIGWPFYRLLLSRCANFYARWVTGVPVRDLTSGFKCYRRAALESLDLDTLQSGGYTFQLESVTRIFRHGCRVIEVPITFRERASGKSKISSIQTIFQTLWLVARLGVERIQI